jgi:ubiquinone/menaquinone biosynthesis C-methylase UbiE
VTSAPIADLGGRRGEEAAHGSAARTMFDRIAPTYDVLNRLLSAGVDRRWRTRAVRETLTAPAGPLLDLCAGTMDLTELLAAARPGDRLVAVDFSPAMLDAGTFAAVVCGFGMRNLADPVAGVREVRRVLRPGGVFVTLELFRPTLLATRAFHGLYASVVLPAVGGWISGDRTAYRYLSQSMAGFLTRQEYERVVTDAGFARTVGIDLTLGIASIVRAQVAT